MVNEVTQRAGEVAGGDDRYRSLFDRMEDGFCIVEMLFDEQGSPCDYLFLEHNRTFEQQTGLVAPLGKTARELVPTLEQYWIDLYGKVALTGEPLRFEQRAVPMKRWFSVYAFRVGGADSRQVAIMFSDITARKAAELRAEFLLQLAKDLAPLAEETDIVSTALSALGHHLGVDRCYFAECLEASNYVIVGENWRRGGERNLAGTYPLYEYGGPDWWNQYSSGNFAVDDVTTHPLTKDKAESYAAVGMRAYLVQPFRHDGKWTVVLAVAESEPRAWTVDEIRLVEDVVSRVWPLVQRARVTRQLRESERALLKSQAELEERVKERTEKLQETVNDLESFSYSISHDLRAPLRAMQTYASILDEECAQSLNQDGREYLRRISAAAERMDRLIQDVLLYSRVAQNDLPLETVVLAPFITGIVQSYPNLTEAARAITLIEPMENVRANPAALTQCLSNLVGNAVKFARPGTEPKIEIWTERRAGKVRVCVRDNGIGIPPALHQKIFGIFYQVKQQPGSTGIGLAVVRKAAERMGGSVSVESTPGEGSTFYLELLPAS